MAAWVALTLGCLSLGVRGQDKGLCDHLLKAAEENFLNLR